MWRSSTFALVLLVAVLLACAEADGGADVSTAVPSTEPVFVERASEAGLDFVHRNGGAGEYNYPELLVGGGALLDFDDDGLLDVYLVQSGPVPGAPEAAMSAGAVADRPGNGLYRNLGDGALEDVTDAAGVGDTGYGAGATAADYDRDGLVDLYVTNVGPNRLYRNLGDGSFEDVTERAGVGDPAWSSSSVFFDYDGDLDLDLFVANYVVWSAGRERPCLGPNGLRNYCNPAEYPPAPDSLYRNDGGGRFTDVSEVAGIRSVAGPGLGVVAADFDGDDLVDLYVANDQAANHLWLNRGDGTFREDALARGAALNELGQPEAGMGIAVADPDGDGDLDLFLTHLSGETNTSYRNDGGGFFRDVTDEARLGGVSKPYTGFGTSWFDYDGDGVLDLFVANGKVTPGDTAAFDYREPNQLLRGMPSGRYEDVSSRAGPALELLEVSRGAAFGDLDNDGDVDVLLVNNEGPVRLFRNDVGNARSWLVVDLCGGGVFDRSAIGARVTVEAAGRSWTREVRAAYSFAVGNDPRVHFGLGDAEQVDRLEVRWPDGTVTDRTNVEVNRILRLLAPGGERPAEGVCRDAE
ncbi:MAG: CRTAC1 family protein [Holophagales bacterium]|nr:CRTAC1 family protein [Holophagales bacterium]MYD23563.1 CRTAC1 family protein [Holophagales bacterium]MYI31369.1 CRTAC1 family protein [Holophagales bacterium]